MRAFFCSIYIACAILCCVGLGTVVTSCSNPEAAAYKTVTSVTITVDAAMKSYATLVVAGKVGTNQQAQVKAAYQKYQASMLLAQRLATTAQNAPAGEQGYVTALNAASQSSLELIALIQQFSAPQPPK